MPRAAARRGTIGESRIDVASRRSGALNDTAQSKPKTSHAGSACGHSRKTERTTEVWLVEIDHLTQLILGDMWPQGSAIEAARQVCEIQPIEPGSRSHWPPQRLVSHIVLRLLLARRIGLAAALQSFATAPGGKPHVASGGPAFSLAHSGNRALIAIAGPDHSGTFAVGIDIEAPRTPKLAARRRDQIVAAGLTVAGGAAYAHEDPDLCFLQAWVRLEAVAKQSGQGMAWLLGRFGIFATAPPSNPDEANDRDKDWLPALDCEVRDVELDGGYFAAVAGTRCYPWTLKLCTVPARRETLAALFGGL